MNIPSSIRPKEINGIVHVREMFSDLIDFLSDYGPDFPEDVQTLINDINRILSYIPTQTSDSNKLADKNFVNSSIATNTATFRGTYNLVDDLSLSVDSTHAEIATALAALSITPDNNDYTFVMVPTDEDTPTIIAHVDRYKYDGTSWSFEYQLNSSGFTAAQWAAIQSGITASIVENLANSDKLVRSDEISTITTLSQASFDAIASKDVHTEYNIIEG